MWYPGQRISGTPHRIICLLFRREPACRNAEQCARCTVCVYDSSTMVYNKNGKQMVHKDVHDTMIAMSCRIPLECTALVRQTKRIACVYIYVLSPHSFTDLLPHLPPQP
jgi:hypothetical protein